MKNDKMVHDFERMCIENILEQNPLESLAKKYKEQPCIRRKEPSMLLRISQRCTQAAYKKVCNLVSIIGSKSLNPKKDIYVHSQINVELNQLGQICRGMRYAMF